MVLSTSRRLAVSEYQHAVSHERKDRAHMEAISAIEQAMENMPKQTTTNPQNAPPVPPFARLSGVDLDESQSMTSLTSMFNVKRRTRRRRDML